MQDEEFFERVEPASVGVDGGALREAVEYAQIHGTPHEQVNYDFANLDPWDEAEGEYGERIGPHPARRGGPSGVVLKDGKLVAEWGDTRRVDQSFSVAKSYLSLVAGVAVDRGLFEVDDRVGEVVDDGGFERAQNESITWRQFLEGTSEWEGTLFGKPDAVDRNRAVGRAGEPLDKAETRDLREPGSFFEYNDVRINRLALSLLRALGRSLPSVLRETVMEPIGATDTWQWRGYYNSRVDVDGSLVESVTGGGHWGGGFWASTRDHARVAQLALDGGAWNGEQLLSPEWFGAATTPSDVNENYGFLWWLNTNKKLWPHAPETAFAALGHGQNVLYADPDNDLVAVLRWLRVPDERSTKNPVQDGFFERLYDGL